MIFLFSSLFNRILQLEYILINLNKYKLKRNEIKIAINTPSAGVRYCSFGILDVKLNILANM